jgi:hypothetical protein
MIFNNGFMLVVLNNDDSPKQTCSRESELNFAGGERAIDARDSILRRKGRKNLESGWGVHLQLNSPSSHGRLSALADST